jgi:ABC-2 type transport system ATP-binding protein
VSETAAAIEVKALKVVRGKQEVLHSLDLTVPAGSITGLLGPSGCGKSTLMRSIVGVQIVDSGTITVLGHPAGTPVLRAQIGYMTQALSVYEDLTVTENVSYFATVLGVGKDDVQRVIEQTAMTAFADRLVSTMSGGQRARVSLATALLGSPKLLVLDEPTVGLDPVLRQELWGIFSQLAASGVTLLVSSHVMDEASRCDELLLMRDGHVLAQGTNAELLARTETDTIERAFLKLVGDAA